MKAISAEGKFYQMVYSTATNGLPEKQKKEDLGMPLTGRAIRYNLFLFVPQRKRIFASIPHAGIIVPDDLFAYRLVFSTALVRALTKLTGQTMFYTAVVRVCTKHRRQTMLYRLA